MKCFFLIVGFVWCFVHTSIAEDFKIKSRLLTDGEVASTFTTALRSKLGIEYTIFRVYEYEDRSGKYRLVMTENLYKEEDGKPLYNRIKAFNFKMENGSYIQKWMIKDFILDDYAEEYYISFWTKYFELKDYDNDGLVDPILVYGTLGYNEYDNGRIKILTFYKEEKRAIRHQNGVHDEERNTQVDKSFYSMPLEIRNRVKIIMKQIGENNHGIFPYGWQEAMEKKTLYFDEN